MKKFLIIFFLFFVGSINSLNAYYSTEELAKEVLEYLNKNIGEEIISFTVTASSYDQFETIGDFIGQWSELYGYDLYDVTEISSVQAEVTLISVLDSDIKTILHETIKTSHTYLKKQGDMIKQELKKDPNLEMEARGIEIFINFYVGNYEEYELEEESEGRYCVYIPSYSTKSTALVLRMKSWFEQKGLFTEVNSEKNGHILLHAGNLDIMMMYGY